MRGQLVRRASFRFSDTTGRRDEAGVWTIRTIVMSRPASAELTPACWAAQSDITKLFPNISIAEKSFAHNLPLDEDIPLEAKFTLEEFVEGIAVLATVYLSDRDVVKDIRGTDA